jgi:hypothetical protein
LPEIGDLFVSSAYRNPYREGEGREICAGACDGLARRPTRLGMPTFKVSSCRLGRFAERMKESGRDRYASEWSCGHERAAIRNENTIGTAPESARTG